MGELGHLVGMPKDFGGAAVDTATTAAPRTATPRTTPIQEPTSLADRVRSALDAKRAEAAVRAPEMQSLRDLGAQQQTSSSFVRMRAPDGEEADIPSHEVPLFQRAGAMRVS